MICRAVVNCRRIAICGDRVACLIYFVFFRSLVRWPRGRKKQASRIRGLAKFPWNIHLGLVLSGVVNTVRDEFGHGSGLPWMLPLME
ncbi:hypothetical protein AKJ16_DCAP00727 [Drosera capensis]